MIILALLGCPIIGHDRAAQRFDPDGDGVDWPVDCDDFDDQVLGPPPFFADGDGDGFGGDEVDACVQPAGTVVGGGDCDDAVPTVNPAAVEVCGGGDEDCDGRVDDADPDVTATTAWLADGDGDGFAAADAIPRPACVALQGTVAAGGDCDDEDPTRSPAADEICDDDVDNDCDGGPGPCAWPDWWRSADADAAIFGGEYDYLDAIAAVDLDGDGVRSLVVGIATLQDEGKIAIFDDLHGTANLIDAPVVVASLPGEGYGSLVADGGDLDGDGDGAILVGADFGDSVYVLESPLPARVDGAVGRLRGEPTSEPGRGMGSAGDVNGDGFGDLVIGAQYADTPRFYGAGHAWVVYGPVVGDVALEDSPMVLRGTETFAQLGLGATGVGDIDGDGLDDVAVMEWGYSESPSGRIAVVFGPCEVVGTAGDADAVVYPRADGHLLGTTLASGDLDQDGRPDLVVGDPILHQVYVAAGPLAPVVHLHDDVLARFDSPIPDQGYADQVAVGDVDGDGADDVLLGAPDNDGPRHAAGAVLVFHGPRAGIWLTTDADSLLTGSRADENLGERVLVPGDVDGDGIDDVLAAARDAGSGAVGAMFLFTGRGL